MIAARDAEPAHRKPGQPMRIVALEQAPDGPRSALSVENGNGAGRNSGASTKDERGQLYPLVQMPLAVPTRLQWVVVRGNMMRRNDPRTLVLNAGRGPHIFTGSIQSHAPWR